MSVLIKRKSFSKIQDCIALPNLVEIQIKSYEQFLQTDRSKRRRKRQGLEAAFQDSFPIESFDGTCRLEYLGYSLGKPKYSISECHKRAMTYAAPLKVKLRLVRKGIAKEQEVYIGELPLMTETGTFIINGAERVIVSQLHRSPGVSLEESTHPSGKRPCPRGGKTADPRRSLPEGKPAGVQNLGFRTIQVPKRKGSPQAKSARKGN